MTYIHKTQVRLLVEEQGADPSYGHCGPLDFSVLHHAVNQRQINIVEYLASKGGDVSECMHVNVYVYA